MFRLRQICRCQPFKCRLTEDDAAIVSAHGLLCRYQSARPIPARPMRNFAQSSHETGVKHGQRLAIRGADSPKPLRGRAKTTFQFSYTLFSRASEPTGRIKGTRQAPRGSYRKRRILPQDALGRRDRKASPVLPSQPTHMSDSRNRLQRSIHRLELLSDWCLYLDTPARYSFQALPDQAFPGLNLSRPCGSRK